MGKYPIKILSSMKTYSISEAKERGLIPLTVWVKDNLNEREFIKSMQDQVLMNENRIAMIVKNGGILALYVDDVSDCRKLKKWRK